MIAKYRLGGLILVGFSRRRPDRGNQPTTNVDSPAGPRRSPTACSAAAGELPAGGAAADRHRPGVRLGHPDQDGRAQLPSAMAFGAAGDPELTEAAWRAAGAELAAVGVNVDFAPVADVLGPAGNAVIGSRSYGVGPGARSARRSPRRSRGLQAAGVAGDAQALPRPRPHHRGQPRAAAGARTRPGSARRRRPAAVPGRHRRRGAGWSCPGTSTCRRSTRACRRRFSHKVLTDLLRRRAGLPGRRGHRRAEHGAGDALAAGRGGRAGAARRQRPAAHAAGPGPAHARACSTRSQAGTLPRARLVEAVTRVLTLKFGFGTGRRPGAVHLGHPTTHGRSPRRRGRGHRAARRLRRPLVTGPVRVTASAGATAPATG